MARIAGITADRTSSGVATIIRLDVRKYADNIHLKNFLKEVGFEVEKSLYNKKFVEKIKSQEDMSAVKIKTEDIWK